MGFLFLSLLQAKVGASLISRLGEGEIPERLLEIRLSELVDQTGISDRAACAFEELRCTFDPQVLLDSLTRAGVEVVTLADEAYPARLRDIPDSPPALFVKGEVPEAPSVALVGSRRASPTGIGMSRDLGRALGARGVCVVSGLAVGVDAAAHEGALEAGTATVGVLGCGIDVVYPRENRKLFGSVEGSGAVLSEYGPGEAPLAWRFPARNRIIAGLSEVVVVVEAPVKSGALITARHALEAGRDVWAVPGPPGARECRGSNKLLADGAGVLWDIAEFVDSVVPQGVGVRTQPKHVDSPPLPVGLPAEEEAVLSVVGYEAAGVDAVAQRTGIEMRQVLPTLALLELKGFVKRDGVGAYTRSTGT